MLKASPISNTAYTACPHTTLKVIAISPLTFVHAFNQHPLAQTHTQETSNPALPCIQATKPTHEKLATKPLMPYTTT